MIPVHLEFFLFLFLVFIYLFLAASGLSCGVRAPECVGSVVAARGLCSCGVRA